MEYAWNDKIVEANFNFDSAYEHTEWGCDDGYTSLSVLINRCQNMIKLRYTNVNRIPPKVPMPITPWSFVLDDIDIVVYMTLRCYDIFLMDTKTFDYRQHFTIKIDDDMDDNIIIVSSVDNVYTEAIRILK